MMELASLLILCVCLVTISVGLLLIKQALTVIHDAVNSNMTRALDEVTQLHKDVSQLIEERNQARVEAGGLEATERLSEQLIKAVDGVIEQQKLVASNLVTAQEAVDGVAEDLAESHQRADEVAHDDPPGAAADAASKLPKKKE